jgi:hypothetical protein
MKSEKSYASVDDIKESANSVPRPIKIPNAIIGYMADLIIARAKYKVKGSVSNSSVSTSSVSNSSVSTLSDT